MLKRNQSQKHYTTLEEAKAKDYRLCNFIYANHPERENLQMENGSVVA